MEILCGGCVVNCVEKTVVKKEFDTKKNTIIKNCSVYKNQYIVWLAFVYSYETILLLLITASI